MASEDFRKLQTALAVENFPISRPLFHRPFLRALALKSAVAHLNSPRGYLDPSIAERVAKYAHGVAEGECDDQFIVDVFQTGSGASTNVNANEVIGQFAGAHPTITSIAGRRATKPSPPPFTSPLPMRR